MNTITFLKSTNSGVMVKTFKDAQKAIAFECSNLSSGYTRIEFCNKYVQHLNGCNGRYNWQGVTLVKC